MDLPHDWSIEGTLSPSLASCTDMTNYRDNIQRVYNGIMIAYIQTTGDQGEVSIIFSASWLKPAIVRLMVEQKIL